MPLGSHTLPVLMILFIGTCIRSTFGFGEALFAMPLLVLIVGVKTAAPLMALIASVIALTILIPNRHKVDLKSTWRLIVSTLAGIPLGLYILKGAPESVMRGILAGVLILFSLYRLFHPKLIVLKREKWAYVFGFVAGILGGSLNTNGPPAVIYGTLKRWSPESFRVTLQGYFFPTGLLIVAGHGTAGFWTSSVLRMFLLALPVVFLAIFIGGRLHKLIPAEKFDRIIYAFLLIMGIGICLQLLGMF
ncbi:sulfite exporter TauE/SafE family protein [bacterium]